MQITAVKTHRILPGESILKIIDEYVPTVPDKAILAITSKILSICQNRVVKKDPSLEKQKLIQEEADFYLEGDYSKKYGICLTIKNKILIPTAGIDESNGNDHYILYPRDIQTEAFKIWQHLRAREDSKSLGILITDSHTTPLRRGVTGIALGWCGFEPLYNYIGKPDIFGKPLQVTMINILDSLAASAVFVMGEGDEQTPLALLENMDKIVYQERAPTQAEVESISISLEEDLYAPLLTSQKWQKKELT